MKHSLILLVGMPRSGTTWIGKIFDGHPDTLYRHEPDSGNALKAIPLIAPIAEADQYRPIIKHFIERLPRINTSRAAGSLPLFPKRYQSAAHLLLKKFAVLATKASEVFARDLPILDFTDYGKIAGLHVVWKSIESLGRLGIILRAVPQCRAIVVLRHPCGYVASVLTGEEENRFSSATASSRDFPVFDMLLGLSPQKQRNPGLDDVKSMPAVERLAWRWVLYSEIALADARESKNCFILRYEDLCAQPIAKAKELFRFAGLPWHAQAENFIHRSTSRSSDHYYSVFKDPADASTKWQRRLNRASIDLIMGVVQKSELRDMYSNATSTILATRSHNRSVKTDPPGKAHSQGNQGRWNDATG